MSSAVTITPLDAYTGKVEVKSAHSFYRCVARAGFNSTDTVRVNDDNGEAHVWCAASGWQYVATFSAPTATTDAGAGRAIARVVIEIIHGVEITADELEDLNH